MLQIIEKVREAYLSSAQDGVSVIKMVEEGFLPFRVEVGLPGGAVETFSILAKHCADAGIRALELLMPEDTLIPSGMSVKVEPLYVQ